MTDQTPTIEPTADELASATAILARAAAAEKAKVDAVAPALKAIVIDGGFASILDAATKARDALPAEHAFFHHLNAMVVGMTNLATDVANFA